MSKFFLLCTLIFCSLFAVNPENKNFRADIVSHGTAYTIHSAADESFLTATGHKFRPDEGIYPGIVLTNEFIGIPNQIWDVIKWPGTNQLYWLLSKGAMLNTVSTIHTPDNPIPPKNLVQFLPVNITLTDSNDESLSSSSHRDTLKFSTVFLLKSVELNTCIQSQGLDFEISYRTCNAENRAQLWFLDYFYEDKQLDYNALARNKLKFYCKFHG